MYIQCNTFIQLLTDRKVKILSAYVVGWGGSVDEPAFSCIGVFQFVSGH